MPRVLSTLLVIALLGGAAAAFAVSEGLKVQRAAVTGTHVDKTFSPVCGCPTQRASIDFKLTRADRLSIAILDPNGDQVRTLVHGRLFGRGKHHFTWNGKDDEGSVVPEASYRPRVRLERTGRTLVLPNPIRVDVTRPAISQTIVRPPVFSPDGDGRSDLVRVKYRVSEHAHALLFVNGKQRIRSRFQRLQDELDWYGRVDGRTLPPGGYRLTVVAVDPAGNRSGPAYAGTVRLRYVELGARVLRSRTGARLRVAVSTDARQTRFVLRRGTSVVASGVGDRVLAFRAPLQAGRYSLVVAAAGHRARAAVIVRP